MAKGNYEKALEIYNKIISENPNEAFAYSGASKCLNMLKRFDEALNMSFQATSLDESLLAPYTIRTYVYLSRGQIVEAVNEASKAISIDSNSFESMECYGTALLFNNMPEEAINWLEKAILINPKSVFALHNLAVAYKERKDYAKHIHFMKEVLKLKPSLKTRISIINAYLSRYSILVTLILFLSILVSYTYKIILVIPLLFIIYLIVVNLVVIKNKSS